MAKTVIVADATDWELVWILNHHGFLTDVPKPVQNVIFRKTWNLQDGYGEAGFTPCQGWDWSGIRDSTAGAKLLMGQMVRAELVRARVTQFNLKEYGE